MTRERPMTGGDVARIFCCFATGAASTALVVLLVVNALMGGCR